ncbi:hypothetical protein DH2020_004040 [Rehmannia glutinosa]|uniref:Uncharacterized protein n=1 Tax=Rehmannia glutinosa TaxID=99300 RepID=A0ABR0XNJ6_REHGL
MSTKSILTIETLIFTIILLVTPSENQLIFADQRLAVVYPIIQKFKKIITYDPFNITASWVGSDVCKYRGFYCEPPPDNKSATALASIDFNNFQLSAPTLEGFLDQLPDIALFHANSNDFSGIISPKVSELRHTFQFLSGSIPPELFDKSLDALFINNNNFMTRLPDNIGSTNIVYLTLANNKFFGPIPRGISRALMNLTEILLLNNMLTGCLPYELGFLKQAVVFDAGNNYLTGPLPFSLGCLENLEILNLAGNLFFGGVPEMLCGLGNLVNLSLSDNYFTHVGPVCWRLIENRALDLRKNCVPGLPFQRSVEECAAFFARPRNGAIALDSLTSLSAATVLNLVIRKPVDSS